MKYALSCVMAVAMTALAPMLAEASINASSYLYISNFKVVDAVTNQVITAGPGGQIALGTPSETSTTTATLNGLTGFGFNLAGITAPVAYSNGVTTVAPGGIENNFTNPLPIPLPYARSDTDGGGSVVTLLPGPPTAGASAQSISDVVAPNSASIDNVGVSAGTQTSTTAFLTTNSSLSVYLTFDAVQIITLSATLPPNGVLLTASSSFATTIGGTGITVGGSASNEFVFKPSELNTGLLTLLAPGNSPTSFAGSFTSPVVTLAPGTYSFGLTQGTTASISSAVPEPATFAAWSLLGIGAIAYGLKRTYFNR